MVLDGRRCVEQLDLSAQYRRTSGVAGEGAGSGRFERRRGARFSGAGAEQPSDVQMLTDDEKTSVGIAVRLLEPLPGECRAGRSWRHC